MEAKALRIHNRGMNKRRKVKARNFCIKYFKWIKKPDIYELCLARSKDNRRRRDGNIFNRDEK